MQKYIFIGQEESTNSASERENVNMVRCDEGKYNYRFTIYDSYQVMFHPYRSTIMMDEVLGELKQNARIKYDIEFDNYDDHQGNKIIGKRCDDSNYVKYGIEKPYKESFKLSDNSCGGSFIINNDGTAELHRYGSGIHYQLIVKGYLKRVL